MAETTHPRPGGLLRGRRGPVRWTIILVAVLLCVAIDVGVRHLPHVVLGPIAVLLGLSTVWFGLRLTPERQARTASTRGPGWWVAWLVAKLSLRAARAFWVVAGLLIAAAGVVTTVAG